LLAGHAAAAHKVKSLYVHGPFAKICHVDIAATYLNARLAVSNLGKFLLLA